MADNKNVTRNEIENLSENRELSEDEQKAVAGGGEPSHTGFFGVSFGTDTTFGLGVYEGRHYNRCETFLGQQ